MPRALVDTTVLFAAAYRRDGAHDRALPVLRGIDAADLPEAVVLDYVLAETLNGLATHAGHGAAVDFLGHVEENARFHIDSLTADAFATTQALFGQYERFSFVDACLVAYIGPRSWTISTRTTRTSTPPRTSPASVPNPYRQG